MNAQIDQFTNSANQIVQICRYDSDQTARFETGNQLTANQIVSDAGLDWDVENRNLYYPAGNGGEEMLHDPAFRALVRADNDNLFGVVKEGYTIIQNRDAFTLLDTLVETHRIEYCSAGYFHGGRKVWVQAKVPEAQIQIKGKDPIDLYLLMRTAHDGKGGLSIFPVFTRIFCSNQIRALSDATAVKLSCSHKPNLLDQMNRAEKILHQFVTNFKKWGELGDALADCLVTTADMNAMLQYIWPDKEDGIERGQKAKEQIKENFESGDSNIDSEQPTGSAWALLQALTYYTNHQQMVKGPREKTLWFGSASTNNWKAMCWLLTHYLSNVPQAYRVNI